METPVLYCVFNRLDVVKKCFEPIRNAKPKKLYLAADGPRSDREGEAELVEACRNYVLEHIDWDCDVKTLFNDQNLGCQIAMSNAIRWFLGQEDLGIVLEDDILTSPQFFEFMEFTLNKYKDNDEIKFISGYNHASRLPRKNIKYNYPYDYVFASSAATLGWGLWKRTIFPKNYESFRFQGNSNYVKELFEKQPNWHKEKYPRIDLRIASQHILATVQWDSDFFFYVTLTSNSNYNCIYPAKTLCSHTGAFGVTANSSSGKSPLDIPIENIDIANIKEPPYKFIDNDYINFVTAVQMFYGDHSCKLHGDRFVDKLRLTAELIRLTYWLVRRYLELHLLVNKSKLEKKRKKYMDVYYGVVLAFSCWIYAVFYDKN